MAITETPLFKHFSLLGVVYVCLSLGIERGAQGALQEVKRGRRGNA